MCLIRLFVLICFLLGLGVVLALIVGCEPNCPAPIPPKHQQGCTPPKVIAFCADWCGPCQQAQPTLRWLEQQGIEVVHVNVDQQPEMCRQYGVTSYPTFFVYVCGHDTVRTQNINEVVNCMYWLKDKHHAESPSQELP